MSDRITPDRPAPTDSFVDDAIQLRLLRTLGPADAEVRSAESRFLARATEYRFAIHRRSDGTRVGRIHLRVTDDPTIVRALGHAGFAVDEAYRRLGYATRAIGLIRQVARHHGVAPLWILIEPDNVPSRRAVERAGLHLVAIDDSAPEAVALGLGSQLCRYAIDNP